MVQFISLCVVLFLAGYAAADPVTGYLYDRDVDAFLRLHTTPATLAEASNRCLQEGALLVSPSNDAEIKAIKRTIAEHGVTSKVLTGVQDKKSSKYVFGNANVAWAEGEANSVDGDEVCVALTSAGAASHVSCSRALPYVCRKEANVKCGPKGNGYDFDARTGSCYKFHRIALAFRPALATCYHEGGHLAIVNSATESSVLREIFAKNPAEVITGSGDTKYAIVGFNLYEDGVWGTIDGVPQAQAGFLQWSNGEPNDDGGEHCGSIHRDGLFNDLHCTYPFAYICEKTPKA